MNFDTECPGGPPPLGDRPMVLVAAVALVDPDGRVLIAQRPEGKSMAGLWEFPGGKVDPGESPESALARELHEELAVLVEVGAALSPVIWNYGVRTIRLLPFRCRITGGELRAIEHEKLFWCLPENFDDLVWADADVPILRELSASHPA